MKDPHLKWYGLHHGWIGAGMAAGGFIILMYAVIPALVVIAIGLFLFIEDVVQHAIQHSTPGYRSPVNRLWGWIVRKWRER